MRRYILVAVGAVLIAIPCWADYLIVSRDAKLKIAPQANSQLIKEVTVGTKLQMTSLTQSNGYYQVEVPDGSGTGWIYRTLARRYSETALSTAGWGLEIMIFSVGQADAIALVGSDGEACVIDAGKDSSAGQRMAKFFRNKSENGVAQIEHVKLAFASHYDEDHIGGFPSLTLAPNGVTLDRVIDQGPSKLRNIGSRSTYGKYLKVTGDLNDNMVKDANELKFVREKAEPGTNWSFGLATIRCVEVRGNTGDRNHSLAQDPANDHIDNENPGSVALTVSLGKFRFYCGGDQTSSNWVHDEPDVERAVLESGCLGSQTHVDVLKVSHHGSDTSSGTNFIRALTPEVAVISSAHEHDALPKLVTIKTLLDNNPDTVVLITGNGADPDTGMFPKSTEAKDDDNYTPPGNVYNDMGDVRIYVSQDGATFRVEAGTYTNHFTSTGNSIH